MERLVWIYAHTFKAYGAPSVLWPVYMHIYEYMHTHVRSQVSKLIYLTAYKHRMSTQFWCRATAFMWKCEYICIYARIQIHSKHTILAFWKCVHVHVLICTQARHCCDRIRDLPRCNCNWPRIVFCLDYWYIHVSMWRHTHISKYTGPYICIGGWYLIHMHTFVLFSYV